MRSSRRLPFPLISRTLATLACARFAIESVDAAVVFSGNFNAGTGQIQFESNYTFTLTGALSANASIVLVFDNAVTSDSSRNFFNSDADTPLALKLNNASYTRAFTIVDNLAATAGAISANDSYLFWSTPVSLSTGNTVVIEAGTYGVQSGANFNPQLNALTFTGNMFLARSSGVRISSDVAAVPEPKVYAALTGIGLLIGGICLPKRGGGQMRSHRIGHSNRI